MNGVAPTDWLNQLAPAHAPPPPGWWPLAPGWWALTLLVVLAVAGLVWWWRRPSRRLRRAALRELLALQAQVLDDAGLAQALENLMRRYALARDGRSTVARLSGQAWLEFVAARGGAVLQGEAGVALLRAVYGGGERGMGSPHRAVWLTGARGFVKHSGRLRPARGGKTRARVAPNVGTRETAGAGT